MRTTPGRLADGREIIWYDAQPDAPLRGQPALPLAINLSSPTFFGTPGFSFPDPHMRTPYVQQVNLSIEREVLSDTMVDVAYVGMYAVQHLYLTAALQPLFIAVCVSGWRSWRRAPG